MITKSIIQYSLVILLIILSIFFYKEYISSEKRLSEKPLEIDKNIENSVKLDDKKVSNTIENLKYVSKDLLGNTYIINAKSAEVQEDKSDQVQLEEVLAKIIQQNDEIIYINSKFADYNRENNNTIFKENVSVQYGNQIINSNIINLNFSKNLIEIQENVYYKNKDANIKADKIEINFESKKLKISMDKQEDKVEIFGKY
jgi:lipopolysaccharide assembly outer membrane protein LptD (OstA)